MDKLQLQGITNTWDAEAIQEQVLQPISSFKENYCKNNHIENEYEGPKKNRN